MAGTEPDVEEVFNVSREINFQSPHPHLFTLKIEDVVSPALARPLGNVQTDDTELECSETCPVPQKRMRSSDPLFPTLDETCSLLDKEGKECLVTTNISHGKLLSECASQSNYRIVLSAFIEANHLLHGIWNENARDVPLIYGGIGIGKSSFAHCLACHFVQGNPDALVIFVHLNGAIKCEDRDDPENFWMRAWHLTRRHKNTLMIFDSACLNTLHDLDFILMFLRRVLTPNRAVAKTNFKAVVLCSGHSVMTDTVAGKLKSATDVYSIFKTYIVNFSLTPSERARLPELVPVSETYWHNQNSAIGALTDQQFCDLVYSFQDNFEAKEELSFLFGHMLTHVVYGDAVDLNLQKGLTELAKYMSRDSVDPMSNQSDPNRHTLKRTAEKVFRWCMIQPATKFKTYHLDNFSQGQALQYSQDLRLKFILPECQVKLLQKLLRSNLKEVVTCLNKDFKKYESSSEDSQGKGRAFENNFYALLCFLSSMTHYSMGCKVSKQIVHINDSSKSDEVQDALEFHSCRNFIVTSKHVTKSKFADCNKCTEHACSKSNVHDACYSSNPNRTHFNHPAFDYYHIQQTHTCNGDEIKKKKVPTATLR